MFSEEEKSTALEKAIKEINDRSSKVKKVTFGYNDCWTFAAIYDQKLRQTGLEASRNIDFEYTNTFGFLRGLIKKDLDLEKLIEYCSYDIVTNRRPILGDVAYNYGATMIANKDGWWVTTSEKNEGIIHCHQISFIERNLKLLARPRSV